MKRIFTLTICFLIALSTACFARALPNSEFSLGGICVTSGVTMSYVRSVYGSPTLVSDDGFTRTYRYGSTVTLKAWKTNAGEERVNYVKTTANNGFATPAGLTVGMSKSTMQGLYGVEDPYYDKKTGYTEYMYPHMGSGAGAGMRILVDDDNTIRSIEVLD